MGRSAKQKAQKRAKQRDAEKQLKIAPKEEAASLKAQEAEAAGDLTAEEVQEQEKIVKEKSLAENLKDLIKFTISLKEPTVNVIGNLDFDQEFPSITLDVWSKLVKDIHDESCVGAFRSAGWKAALYFYPGQEKSKCHYEGKPGGKGKVHFCNSNVKKAVEVCFVGGYAQNPSDPLEWVVDISGDTD